MTTNEEPTQQILTIIKEFQRIINDPSHNIKVKDAESLEL